MSGSVFLASTRYSVGENENTVTVTIERTGDLSQPVTVEYNTNPGSASAGADFVDSDGSVVIPAGIGQVSVTVPIVNDSDSEPTEEFSFALVSVSSGSLLFPRTATISILDDENPVTEPVDPPLQSQFDVSFQNVVSGLSIPMNIEWLPGGSNLAFVPEKSGKIKLVDFSNGSVTTALDISAKVNDNGDRGLMDVALHPDLENNPYLYAFYVVDPPQTAGQGGNAGSDGAGNRFAHVVRYELDLSGSTPQIIEASEEILIGGAGQSLSDIAGNGALNYTEGSNENEPASDVDPDTGEYRQDYIKVDSQSHAGGALAFGPDGALYISIGDGTSFNIDDPRTVSVQSVDALAGKILRVDPLTGDGLSDNPFVEPGDDLGANKAKVFQMGLRNPFTMAFSDDGKLFITDTGWYSWEEVNNGEPGANFGWPFYEGGDSGILERTPLYSQFPEAAAFYQAVDNGDIVVTAPYRGFARSDSEPGYAIQAIVGASSVYDGSQYPSVFTDDYFFLDVVNGQVFAVDVNDRTQLQYLTKLPQNIAALTFSQGPDGYLYYTDFLGTIGRMEITDPNATPNGAPFVANAIDTTQAVAGEAFSFALPDGVFFDPDGDALNLQATLSNGAPLPGWLSFDPASGTFTGTPQSGDLGAIAIKVIADDGITGEAQEVFMLKVVQSVSPPQLVRPADNQQATEDQAFTYTLPADMFIDDGALQLSASLASGDPLPQWLSFDPATGTFSGTPDDADIGVIAVTVTATDLTGLSVNDSFAITIGGQNDAPVSSGDPDDGSVTVGTAFSLTLPATQFTDPDGDDLTLTATLASGDPLPTWLNFDPATQTFAGTPQQGDAAQLDIVITATDPSNETATAAFTLTVEDPPQGAPFVANPIANQSTAEEAAFSFTVPADTFDDPDNDVLTYAAALANGDPLPTWLSFDPATRSFSGTPDDPQVGKLLITVTATDPSNASASDTFELDVTPVNDAPVSSGDPDDGSVTVGTAFSLTLPATQFTDPDGDDLTLTATLASGDPLPTWLNFDPATQTFAGTPQQGDTAQLDIVITATDPSNETATAGFTLTVEDPPQGAPFVANPIANQETAEEAAFSFTVPADTFDDPDNDVLTYAAALANGDPLPTWLSFDPATRSFSGTPDDPQVGKLLITVTATDPGNASATSTFELDVTAVNDAPQLDEPIADQDAQIGSSFTFALPQQTFSDVDDATLTLDAALANGDPLPSWLVFDPQTGTFNGTPPANSAGIIDIEVTATDGQGEAISDIFELTVEEATTGETLYNDQPNVTQYLTGTADNDIFVIDGRSNDYSWASTQDGMGIVVWGPTGHDLLYGFEAIRFNDLTAPLVQDDSRYEDIPGLTQYITGTTANDVFVIDGDAGDYNWGTTQDGQGVVVWNDQGHDILYDFEGIEFNDQTVSLVDEV